MFLSNRQIKYLASLSRKKYRQEHQQTIIEGIRLCEEALQSDWALREAYVTSDFFTHPAQDRLAGFAGEKHLTLNKISPEEMERITDTRSPQSIAILTDLPEQKPFIPDRDWHPQLLILDQLSDPGILVHCSDQRTGLVCVKYCWAPVQWNGAIPKFCEDPWGLYFEFELYEITDWATTLLDLGDAGFILLGAGMAGKSGRAIAQSIQDHPWALLLGNEAHGLSEELIPYMDEIITIPGEGPADSLNVAMAGTVLLYELATSSSKS